MRTPAQHGLRDEEYAKQLQEDEAQSAAAAKAELSGSSDAAPMAQQPITAPGLHQCQTHQRQCLPCHGNPHSGRGGTGAGGFGTGAHGGYRGRTGTRAGGGAGPDLLEVLGYRGRAWSVCQSSHRITHSRPRSMMGCWAMGAASEQPLSSAFAADWASSSWSFLAYSLSIKPCCAGVLMSSSAALLA